MLIVPPVKVRVAPEKLFGWIEESTVSVFAVALPVVIDTSVPEFSEPSMELAFRTVVWVGSKLAE
jgi:hypothetical protein